MGKGGEKTAASNKKTVNEVVNPHNDQIIANKKAKLSKLSDTELRKWVQQYGLKSADDNKDSLIDALVSSYKISSSFFTSSSNLCFKTRRYHMLMVSLIIIAQPTYH